jgi:hypothetical protein
VRRLARQAPGRSQGGGVRGLVRQGVAPRAALRARVAGLVALVCAGTVLAGCGITDGPVIPQSRAQQQEEGRGSRSPEGLMRRENETDAKELVRRFLMAAAADNPQTREKTLLSYTVDGDFRGRGNDIVTVVRVLEITQGPQSTDSIPVRVRMQRIGTLTDGRIDPLTEQEEGKDFTFTAVEQSGKGYFLKDPPTELLLSEQGLSDRFEMRPLYFWAQGSQRLVPDLRYVSIDLDEPVKAKQLIDWLYAGPVDWLKPAVKPVPREAPHPTSLPVYSASGTLTIDLPSPLADSERERLHTQLEWTLRWPTRVLRVELKVQGQQVQPIKSQPIEDLGPAQRYAVVQEKAVRLYSDEPLPLPTDVNSRVSWVAFSRGEVAVALQQVEGGAARFLIGPSGAPKQVGFFSKPVGQAVWLDGESRAALVLYEGKLYEVTLDGRVTLLAGQVPGPVTSFSVVPDGRVALVANGRLWIAALFRPETRVLSITQPQQVPTTFQAVQQVAFSRRQQLVVSGVAVEYGVQLITMTVTNLDGARALPEEGPWPRYALSQQISRLTTDYRNGQTYYNNGGVAYQLQQRGGERIGEKLPAEQVGRPRPMASASPSPTDKALVISSACFEG